MERAPPPALAAAALAAMDEAFMDTPLSPKRPRQDDPPDRGPRPRTPENGGTTACMLAAASMQHTHITPHSHPSHTTQEGRSNREGLRAWPLHSRGTALVLRHEGLARHHHGHDPRPPWGYVDKSQEH